MYQWLIERYIIIALGFIIGVQYYYRIIKQLIKNINIIWSSFNLYNPLKPSFFLYYHNNRYCCIIHYFCLGEFTNFFKDLLCIFNNKLYAKHIDMDFGSARNCYS